MGFVFHGLGTMTYGEQDYWPDGSFVTTEWFVVAYLPIIPSLSMRLSYTPNAPYATYDSDGYFIYETLPIKIEQVLGTYAWFTLFVGIFVAWGKFHDLIEKRVGNADLAAGLWLLLLALILALPFALRRLAKWRKMQKWKRMNAGLEPFSYEE